MNMNEMSARVNRYKIIVTTAVELPIAKTTKNEQNRTDINTT